MHRRTLPLGPADDSRRRTAPRSVLRGALLALCATTLTLTGIDALAAPSAAVGPIEITQAKALNGNVTPGDTAGFPVTISAPGSYRLMSNLTVPDLVTTAIVIAANDVTLDLNGFTIAGPQRCGPSGTPTCPYNEGGGDGIRVAAPGRYANIAIANGTVRGFGRHGLSDADMHVGVLVQHMRALDNGGNGFGLNGALVVHSIAARNGLSGFQMTFGDVQSSIAWGNGHWGLIGTGVTFGGSHLSGNGSGQAYPGLRQTTGNLCNDVLCP